MPVITARELSFADLPGRASADPLPPGLAQGCSVRLVRVPAGPRTPHRHPRSAEVAYVAAGAGIAWEDGSTARVAAGDVIAVPRGVPHATAAGPEGLVLVCFFPDEDLRANLEELTAPLVSASVSPPRQPS